MRTRHSDKAQKNWGHPRQIRQILNSTAIAGEKIAKEN
jgi:hypothetical protein